MYPLSSRYWRISWWTTALDFGNEVDVAVVVEFEFGFRFGEVVFVWREGELAMEVEARVDEEWGRNGLGLGREGDRKEDDC